MNICIFGDSITWGATDLEKGGWAERLKTSYWDFEADEYTDVYNLGIPGNDTNDLLKRFNSEAAIREPDLIIFAIGTNDSQYVKEKNNLRTTLDAFDSNLTELLNQAHEFTNKVIFVGLAGVHDPQTTLRNDKERYYDSDTMEKYEASLKNFCNKNSIDFIEIKKLMTPSRWEDGLHPDSTDHEIIFKEVRTRISNFV